MGLADDKNRMCGDIQSVSHTRNDFTVLTRLCSITNTTPPTKISLSTFAIRPFRPGVPNFFLTLYPFRIPANEFVPLHHFNR